MVRAAIGLAIFGFALFGVPRATTEYEALMTKQDALYTALLRMEGDSIRAEEAAKIQRTDRIVVDEPEGDFDWVKEMPPEAQASFHAFD